MIRKQITTIFIVLLLGSISTQLLAGSENKKSLTMGLLPYLSPSELVKVWDPLVKYLELNTGRKIKISSAPDFNTYIKRAAKGKYDIYLTAPHFALLAEKNHQYRRLARLKRELDGAIVVAHNSKIKRFADLHGKIFATPDKLAIITMLGEAELEAHKVLPHKDIKIKYTPSHNNALLSVIEGTADAAVTSTAVYDRLPTSKKSKLKLLTKTRQVPHMMFMAGPSVSADTYGNLATAFQKFTANKDGKAFFAQSGYGDMTGISSEDMQRLELILPILANRVDE